VPAAATLEVSEGNGLLHLQDVVEELLRTLRRHATDGTRNLDGILVVHADVVAAGLADGLRVLGLTAVLDHFGLPPGD
jgi:hypothetical protein